MIRSSNLFTALLKEIVNSAKKVSVFEEVGGLYTLMQNHLFLDMVISVQIVSLRFVSRSLSLLVIIPFFTNSINPPPLLFQWRGASFLDGGRTPWGGTSDLKGGGVSKKIEGWGCAPMPSPPHPGSEELKKCPPPSTAGQRFVNVRERKPR